MMQAAKLVSTCLGIGYMGKGGGTVAAAVCCTVWYFAQARGIPAGYTIAFTIALFFLGAWAARMVEPLWGEDSNRVVVDEWQGMCVALLLLPSTPAIVISAFVLFRFFDIVKPFFIRKAERLPSGWGVMSDDLLAGIYSNIILQIAIQTNLFAG